VTQPEASSINGLPELLKRYDARVALTNGQPGASDEYQALTRAWTAAGTRVITATAGYTVEISDGVMLEILHPQTVPDLAAEPDDATLVLRLSYENASFLLSSDLSEFTIQTLQDSGWYMGSTVLELPSHGSAAVNTEHFLESVNPQVAVVELGAGNRSSLPAPEVIEQLQAAKNDLYRTDHHGTIEIVSDGHTLWIYTGR
jgi:beta-lactamase superfamily II metal-dependent hydrolase